MKAPFNYLRLLLFSISGMLVLCIVFAVHPELAMGVITGKVFWFHFSMLFLSGTAILAEIITHKDKLRLILPDILLLILTGILLVTYNWDLNPEPGKLIFFGQLIALWFILRVAFNSNPSLRLFFLSIIACIGFIESIVGMQQLYGISTSNHTFFRLTGSFFNPGPFSGYLAIVLPISFSMILRFSNCNKKAWWDMRTVLYYLGWLCTIGILIVLPAGMSRSAWLAAFVSCMWVYWMHRIGWRKTKEAWYKYKKPFITISLIVTAILIIGLSNIYQIKRDSSDERLLIWKVTTQALAKNPIKGTGIGGFRGIYGETQAEYFASGKASDNEKIIATSPEFAFNEILQFALELGVFGAFIFLLWVGTSFYYGIKNRRVGPTGSLLSLGIFALTAYPFQLPSFWILLIFCSVICIAGSKPSIPKENWYKNINLRYVGIFASLLSFLMCYLQKDQYDAYKEWGTTKALYNSKAYDVAAEKYEALYKQLNHVPEYLLEYAQSISKAGNPEKANELLYRASLLSSDPMIHYMIAKNDQELENYIEAEKRLYHAIDILPERIYPYYLLTKLYADTEFYRPEKLKAAADSVLKKEPRIHTAEIRWMREEVKKLITNLDLKQ